MPESRKCGSAGTWTLPFLQKWSCCNAEKGNGVSSGRMNISISVSGGSGHITAMSKSVIRPAMAKCWRHALTISESPGSVNLLSGLQGLRTLSSLMMRSLEKKQEGGIEFYRLQGSELLVR